MPNHTVSDLPGKIQRSVEELRQKEIRISVRAACAGVCSPQTLYDYDKPLPVAERLVPFIKAQAKRQQELAKRARRRGGSMADQERILRLEDEAAGWRTKYESLLERLTLLEHECRDSGIDVAAVYRHGLVKPDRSINRSGQRRASTDGTSAGRVPLALT